MRNICALGVRLMALAGGATGGKGEGTARLLFIVADAYPQSARAMPSTLYEPFFLLHLLRTEKPRVLFRSVSLYYSGFALPPIFGVVCVSLSSRTRRWSVIEGRHVNVNPVLFPPVNVCGIFIGRKA